MESETSAELRRQAAELRVMAQEARAQALRPNQPTQRWVGRAIGLDQAAAKLDTKADELDEAPVVFTVRRVGPPILVSLGEYEDLIADREALGAWVDRTFPLPHTDVPPALAGPGRNLRVAERMASLGHSPRVERVVHIAEAPRCPAHGDVACTRCAQNPANCGPGGNDSPDCAYYRATGMHWDTCPNRVRSAPPS